MKNEIIVYQSDDFSTHLEVRVENDTVWLNRHQIAELFDRDVKTIGKHINNALKEELKDFSVVAKFATTASDGKTYQVDFYSLDMVTSVGYRVKSTRGIQFRVWANKILKDYLLKGYVLNQRVENIENDLRNIKHEISEINLQIKTSITPREGIFYDGQVFDAYFFVNELIKKAKTSIVLIDNYIDESVLLMLSKRSEGVEAIIFTRGISPQLNLDLAKHNQQYPSIKLKTFTRAHDRFLVIDRLEVYHIGASLKDLGRKLFAFSKMEMEAADLLGKLKD